MGKLGSGIFAGAVVALTLVACGSDDDGALFVTVSDSTMQALSETLCGKYQECAGDLLIQVAYGSNEGCTARIKSQFALDVRSRGYSISDSGANTCLDAVKATACGDILDGKLPDACDFKGSLADGNSCTADAQCASGSCFIDDAAKCGKCGPRAAMGADCTNANCGRGLRCNATKKCTDGSIGAVCTVDSDCHALSYCRKGACVAALEEGATCVQDSGTTDPPCNLFKGLLCSPNPGSDGGSAGTCRKQTIANGINGEKCGVTALVPLTFKVCANGDCVKRTSGAGAPDSFCTAHIADGAPCIDNEDGHAKCQEPAKCRAGVCSLKDPNTCQ